MWCAVDAVLAKVLCVKSREISKNGGRPRKKTEMSRYLSENTKTGNFNQQRTLSGSFFVIPERFAAIRAVVLAFTAIKQTSKHSIIYIDT